jgi:hypothetical protein
MYYNPKSDYGAIDSDDRSQLSPDWIKCEFKGVTLHFSLKTCLMVRRGGLNWSIDSYGLAERTTS